MRDSEIKTLFAKADEQVHVDEIRKQKTYYAMIEEMEKQRTPMMSTKNILFHQFWYMDKLFFAVYGVLICLGIIFITALQYTGLNQNGMITVWLEQVKPTFVPTKAAEEIPSHHPLKK
jgi:hypothetical protein